MSLMMFSKEGFNEYNKQILDLIANEMESAKSNSSKIIERNGERYYKLDFEDMLYLYVLPINYIDNEKLTKDLSKCGDVNSLTENTVKDIYEKIINLFRGGIYNENLTESTLDNYSKSLLIKENEFVSFNAIRDSIIYGKVELTRQWIEYTSSFSPPEWFGETIQKYVQKEEFGRLISKKGSLNLKQDDSKSASYAPLSREYLIARFIMYQVENNKIEECKKMLLDIKKNFKQIVEVCKTDFIKTDDFANASNLDVKDWQDLENGEISYFMYIKMDSEFILREQQALWKLQLS